MNLNKLYMDVAINKALQAKGFQSPNPKVGCIILRNNTILGIGYHQTYGKDHAEVIAIKDALTRVSGLKGTTMYVTLSPCSKTGKTPPCVDLIIKNKISKIFIGSIDPSDEIGIIKLKKAGVEIIMLNSQKAKDINRQFFYNISHKKPYVAIKVATTLDGFSATKNSDSKWITSTKMREFSRQKRSEYQAILIGTKTLKLDNPTLSTRVNGFYNPVIIILAPNFFDWEKYKLFKTNLKKIVFVNKKIKTPTIKNVSFIKIDSEIFSPNNILRKIWKLNIQSVLVEGGSFTQNLFLKNKCVNEINIYYGNKILGDTKGLNIFNYKKTTLMSDIKRIELLEHKVINNQIYTKWRIK